MYEYVLLYNLSSEQKSRLTRMFLIMKVHMIFVEPSQYGKSIGQLLGKEDMLPSLEAFAEAEQEKDTLNTPMMVMYGFNNVRLDALLKGFRKNHVPPIGLKAIVTPANITWTSLQLYRELQREHAAFQNRRS